MTTHLLSVLKLILGKTKPLSLRNLSIPDDAIQELVEDGYVNVYSSAIKNERMFELTQLGQQEILSIFNALSGVGGDGQAFTTRPLPILDAIENLRTNLEDMTEPITQAIIPLKTSVDQIYQSQEEMRKLVEDIGRTVGGLHSGGLVSRSSSSQGVGFDLGETNPSLTLHPEENFETILTTEEDDKFPHMVDLGLVEKQYSLLERTKHSPKLFYKTVWRILLLVYEALSENSSPEMEVDPETLTDVLEKFLPEHDFGWVKETYRQETAGMTELSSPVTDTEVIIAKIFQLVEWLRGDHSVPLDNKNPQLLTMY